MSSYRFMTISEVRAAVRNFDNCEPVQQLAISLLAFAMIVKSSDGAWIPNAVTRYSLVQEIFRIIQTADGRRLRGREKPVTPSKYYVTPARSIAMRDELRDRVFVLGHRNFDATRASIVRAMKKPTTGKIKLSHIRLLTPRMRLDLETIVDERSPAAWVSVPRHWLKRLLAVHDEVKKSQRGGNVKS